MKKIFLILTVTIFAAGGILTGCQTSDQKVKAAEDKVYDSQRDLYEAQKDAALKAQETDNDMEWLVFKTEAEKYIKANEIRIDDLKAELKKRGKTNDEIYKTRLETQEQNIKIMRKRLNEYEDNQTDWVTFRNEFNRDMDNLEKALKEFWGKSVEARL